MTTTFDLENAVRLAQGGDERAFGELVVRYKNLVFSVALSVLRDADAASDVTQSVFLAAWQKLRELRSPSSLPPWLRETARRQALHHLRGTIHERQRVADAPVPDAALDADAQLVAHEEARALEAALDEVPDDAREVLLLYYSEEQSVTQVAMLLELSEDAVKKRLQRARGALRAEYEQALERRVKRVLPGSAMIAAILGGLTRSAHAARWPRFVVAGAIASSLVAAVAGYPHVVHAPTSPFAAAVASATGSPTPVASRSVSAPGPSSPPPAVRQTLAARCEQPARDPALAAVARRVARAEKASTDVYIGADKAAALSTWRMDVTWLVERCPAAAFFEPGALQPSMGRAPDRALLAAWRDAYETYRDDPRVLGNVAAFLVSQKPARAQKLIERAAALEPKNDHWVVRLAELHALRGRNASGAQRVEHDENAVGYFDEALGAEHDPEKRRDLLAKAMEAAFQAHEDATAEQYAHEVIALAATAPKPAYLSELEVYSAKVMLARVAFATGKEDTACRLLLASVDGKVPNLAAANPDLVLPRKLIERGHGDVVRRYFKRFVEDHPTLSKTCISVWIAALEAGEQPHLDSVWGCADAR